MIRANLIGAGVSFLNNGDYVRATSGSAGATAGNITNNNTYEIPAENTATILCVKDYSAFTTTLNNIKIGAFNDISDATLLTLSNSSIDISNYDYLIIETSSSLTNTLSFS